MHPSRPNSLIGLTVCLFYFPASTVVAYEEPAQEIAPQNVPLGGVDCEHDTGPSLLIEPRAHLRAVVGDSGIEDTGLAHGGHDPAHSGFSIPSLSLGADILYGEHIAGFTEGIISWNDEDGWNAELEEIYAKFLNIPGGFEIKAGRLLTAVGTQNNVHNHGWHFVDNQLGNVRFLGEDALAVDGVEVTWMVPTHWDDRLILSFGDAVVHEHEEDSHMSGGAHDAHDHSEEAEEALWEKNILSARYQATLWPGDTCKFVYGASYVQGENFMGKTGRLYELDLTYTWLQDEDHGKQFTWHNEAMMRSINTDEGKFEEFAFSSSAIYKFNLEWEMGMRYDYVEGVADPELPERHRVSPTVARYFKLGSTEAVARLQYNYDHSEERGDDHSVWLLFGFEWGVGGDAHVH